MIFTTYPTEESAHDITQIRLVTNGKGKLTQVCQYERFGRWLVWGSRDENATWDFEEMNAERLTEVLTRFALSNPQMFRKAFYHVKGKDPEVFECFKKAKENIRKMFSFY